MIDIKLEDFYNYGVIVKGNTRMCYVEKFPDNTRY